MQDRVFQSFLQRQYQEGLELAQSSDLLDVFPAVPVPGAFPFVFQAGDPKVTAYATPPDRYLARFHCTGLVRPNEGEVCEADEFAVGIWFPSEYLRRIDPYRIVTWLGPGEAFHPNIWHPFICIGRMAPGTPLTDILYQCFEIITYRKVTMREDDALNKTACAWAREHQDRFPVDRRPFRRRQLELTLDRTNGE